jgi:hypothetical protein
MTVQVSCCSPVCAWNHYVILPYNLHNIYSYFSSHLLSTPIQSPITSTSHFSLFTFHFSLFTFHFSLFTFHPGASMRYPTNHIHAPMTIPTWAIQERQLINTLNHAAREYINRYVRPDGTLIWRDEWPGMDGSDDPYEGFMQLALLYVLGGDDWLYDEARRIWDGITWQWTEYGQVDREFTKYYDWMHHGEGYLYIYFLGLANPTQRKDRQRAQRFANMYTGHDPLAPNYDPQHKLFSTTIWPPTKTSSTPILPVANATGAMRLSTPISSPK